MVDYTHDRALETALVYMMNRESYMGELGWTFIAIAAIVAISIFVSERSKKK